MVCVAWNYLTMPFLLFGSSFTKWLDSIFNAVLDAVAGIFSGFINAVTHPVEFVETSFQFSRDVRT
jgi:hypothetical protein